MKLHKAKIRQGNLMEVLENGVIKASAPGLFSFSDDPAKLPPIMPWQIGSNCNSFSKPKLYENIWIMNFLDNPTQLYWFRKDRVSDNSNINITEENVEILCNRDVNGEWATIYFSDGSGWVISKGVSLITINGDGNIILDTGLDKRAISISPESIALGTASGKASHPAAYGDEVVDVLSLIVSMLKQIQLVAMPNPHTMAIGTILSGMIPLKEAKIPNITSTNVSLE